MRLLLLIPLIFSIFLIPAYGDYYNIYGTFDKYPKICIVDPERYDHLSKYQIIKGVKAWKVAFEEAGNTNFGYDIFWVNGFSEADKRCNIKITFVDGIFVGGIKENATGKALCTYSELSGCLILINNEYRGLADLQTSITHELGHAFGLGHRLPHNCESMGGILITNDIMIFQSSPFKKIIHTDLQALYTIYGQNGWELPNYPIEKYIISRNCV